MQTGKSDRLVGRIGARARRYSQFGYLDLVGVVLAAEVVPGSGPAGRSGAGLRAGPESSALEGPRDGGAARRALLAQLRVLERLQRRAGGVSEERGEERDSPGPTGADRRRRTRGVARPGLT